MNIKLLMGITVFFFGAVDAMGKSTLLIEKINQLFNNEDNMILVLTKRQSIDIKNNDQCIVMVARGLPQFGVQWGPINAQYAGKKQNSDR